MTVIEIATIAFAATTAVMTALYWHEVSKAAKFEESTRFDDIERRIYDTVRDASQHLERKIDECERQISFLGEDISDLESKLPTKPR
jgi:hypothetical protein